MNDCIKNLKPRLIELAQERGITVGRKTKKQLCDELLGVQTSKRKPCISYLKQELAAQARELGYLVKTSFTKRQLCDLIERDLNQLQPPADERTKLFDQAREKGIVVTYADSNQTIKNLLSGVIPPRPCIGFPRQTLIDFYGSASMSKQKLCDSIEKKPFRSHQECQRAPLTSVIRRAPLEIFTEDKTKKEICNEIKDYTDRKFFLPRLGRTNKTQGIYGDGQFGIYHYLNKLFNDRVCIAFSKQARSNNLIAKGFRWNDAIQQMRASAQTVKEIDHCMMQTKSTFVVIPVNTYTEDYPISHMNILLYDRRDHSLEHFEPHGQTGPFANQNKLVFHVAKWFNRRYDKSTVKIVYPHDNFCPPKGLQRLQLQEHQKQRGDPIGFCTQWSAFYVYLRTINPNISRKKVQELAIESLPKNQFTQFIRSFSKFSGALLSKYQK